MSIQLVQSNNGGQGSFVVDDAAITSAVGYTENTTSGSLLVLVAAAQSDSTTVVIETPVTSGFTWTSAGTVGYNTGTAVGRVSIYYIENAAAMSVSTTTTVRAAKVDSGSEIEVEFSLYEFSGVAKVSSLETSATKTGVSSSPNTTNLSTTKTDLIIVSAVDPDSSPLTAGSGYTLGIGSVLVQSYQTQYILNKTSGSISTAFSGTASRWGAVALAFIPDASSAIVTGVSMTAAQHSPTATGDGNAICTGVSVTSSVGVAIALSADAAHPNGVAMISAVGSAFGSVDGSAIVIGVSMTASVGQANQTGKRQISGGNFQDSSGRTISQGSITFRLTTDALASHTQVSSAVLVTANLDANGNILGTVLIWPNDQLTPSTTYKIRVYTAKGEVAWESENVIPSGISVFDIGTLVPLY